MFLSHLHADHIGDLAGMILYPWGIRADQNGPLAPLRVYGPSRPAVVPAGDATFHRQTTIHPELPAPGTADVVQNILASYVYHLNVMPLDARMPAAGALVRAIDIGDPARTEASPELQAATACAERSLTRPAGENRASRSPGALNTSRTFLR